ncbi:MAG: YidC/Oxa1 family membrane protein insertase [Clostridia bacterium]|nr:YidC/Oxa1 family membrane protein insertase [Clostridia bacterium]
MKKIFNSKFFSIIVLLVVACALLTSCIGAPQQQTIQKSVTNYDGSKNSLKQEELNAIATTIYNNKEAKEAFFAAYRGYDVVDGQYSDFSQDLGVNYDYVKKVISKYAGVNFATEAPVVTPDEEVPEGETPEGETPEEEITENLPKFAQADADLVLLSIQDTVELKQQRDLLGNIRFYIGTALNWITKTVGFGNYIIGICVFAIVVELCMMPLTIKQQKNSIKQAMLRPKEMAIRNRYKGRNDQATQQKVAQEIQDLYQRENFNPMGGCLPMLIQLPIIMILYNIVVDPIQNVLGGSASFVNAIKTFFTTSQAAGGLGLTLKSTNGSIELLSQLKNIDFSGMQNFAFFSNGEEVYEQILTFQGNIPSFNIGSLNFGFTPSFKENYLLLLVPVLTFVVYFFSMKISKKFMYQPTQNENAPGAGCSTKMMEYSMPLMSTYFAFLVPGAVGIYWIFRSLIMTLKQFIMSKIMPLPQFTEEDFKAAERELGSKKPQRKRKSEANLDPNRERPRSLHHIDDDDEEYPTFIQ